MQTPAPSPKTCLSSYGQLIARMETRYRIPTKTGAVRCRSRSPAKGAHSMADAPCACGAQSKLLLHFKNLAVRVVVFEGET